MYISENWKPERFGILLTSVHVFVYIYTCFNDMHVCVCSGVCAAERLLAENAASIVSHLHVTVVFERCYRLYGVYFQWYGKFFLTYMYTVHARVCVCSGVCARSCVQLWRRG